MTERPIVTARETVLMTLEATGEAPSVGQAAQMLGVPIKTLDADFGVVAIDPDRGLYTVRVFADMLKEGGYKDRPGVSGPFSNPGIAPYGTPRR